MKLGILLAMMLCASAAKAEPLTDASNRYVLIGKHSESWSLCYANIVAEKFKDATYVEAEAAESAKAEVDVQCKPAPPRDWLEKEAQKSCDEAQKQNLARQRSEARQKRANSDPASEGGIEQLLPGMSVERTSDPCRYAPPTRPVGGGRCYSAAAEVKRSQVLTVTNRLGPYPTADRAADDLSADGWQTGTNPSSGKPIWFKRFGCEQDPNDRSR
jgi:hypothetical protein